MENLKELPDAAAANTSATVPSVAAVTPMAVEEELVNVGDSAGERFDGGGVGGKENEGEGAEDGVCNGLVGDRSGGGKSSSVGRC
ncbi:Hypothetical predicted protein [Olea europaea subsp. europaea]|uniref:Uncharacterized protein n=1 Tax=Olea europaea subsp. europaea TaxID=158383 RepID=A0A8S0TDQ5_OLEEU|nr:Hypothetical predicted protein [Olea europaea subsp. europaea]